MSEKKGKAPGPRSAAGKAENDLHQSTYSAKLDEYNRVEAARNDLLALGIDLDSDLIDRLQSNLGANLTFAATSKAASVVRSRNNNRNSILYRNVSSSANTSLHKIRTSTDEIVQVDMLSINSILSNLKSLDSSIQSQIRSGILKLLVSLSHIYGKKPDEFMKTMNGTVNSNDIHKYNLLDYNVQRLLERYIDEDSFIKGIKEVQQNKNFNDNVVRTLFELIATENHPVPSMPERQQQGEYQPQPVGTTGIKKYVDIWVFLTLLKSAAEEDRRSFDSKTSTTAHNVEFWNQKRAPVKNESKKQTAKDFMDANTANMIRHTSKSTLNRENMSGKSGMMRQALMEKELCSSERLWDDSEVIRQRQKERAETVSALLGNHARKFDVPSSDVTRGRGVVGKLASEMNRDRVADVLHSPIKISQAKVTNDDFKPRKKAWISTEQTWHDAAVNVANEAVAHTKSGNSMSVLDANAEDMSLPPSQSGVGHDHTINYIAALNKGSLSSNTDKHYKVLPPAWEREGAAVAAALHPTATVIEKENRFYNAPDTTSTVEHPNYGTSQPRLKNSYNSFHNEDVNLTTVASALGCERQDNKGRHMRKQRNVVPVAQSNPTEPRQRASNNNNSSNMSALMGNV